METSDWHLQQGGPQLSFVHTPRQRGDADLYPLTEYWNPKVGAGLLSPPWLQWLMQQLHSADLKAHEKRRRMGGALQSACFVCAEGVPSSVPGAVFPARFWNPPIA